jgi:hypothetical protein
MGRFGVYREFQSKRRHSETRKWNSPFSSPFEKVFLEPVSGIDTVSYFRVIRLWFHCLTHSHLLGNGSAVSMHLAQAYLAVRFLYVWYVAMLVSYSAVLLKLSPQISDHVPLALRAQYLNPDDRRDDIAS